MTNIRCTAEFRTEGEQLTADRAFTEFVTALPSDAVLASISVEKGSQRDPWTVLVGLRATWEEDR